MRRARREVQTPAPCTYYVSAEYRLAVESYYMIHFIIAHFYRPVARSCISLSSGISMFARER